MMRFYLEINTTKESAIELSYLVKEFICLNGANVVNDVSNADIIISLGGDGTMLRTWRKYRALDKAIFGINCGTLGYLTEGTINNWDEKISNIIANNMTIKDRTTLVGDVYHNNNIVFSDVALNDIVLSKCSGSVIRCDIEVNDKFLTSFNADGIICSTSIGSTGYALSAGGAFLDPDSNAIEIVPIAPHTLLNRAIVLDGNSNITIKLNGRNVGVASYDGYDYSENIQVGDYIKIHNGNQKMKMVVIDEESFIATVSKTFTKI